MRGLTDCIGSIEIPVPMFQCSSVPCPPPDMPSVPSAVFLPISERIFFSFNEVEFIAIDD